MANEKTDERITMRMYQEMDIGDVLAEIDSDIADLLCDMFGGAAQDILERRLDEMDLDECSSYIENNVDEIVASIMGRLDRPITRDELKRLESTFVVTQEQLEAWDVEVEPPQIDEEGREYVMVDEDRRQMRLLTDPDENGRPMKVRFYPSEFPISGMVPDACAAAGLNLAVLSTSAAQVGSSTEVA